LGQESRIENREISEGLADREKKFQAATGLAIKRMYKGGQVRKGLSS